MMSVAPCLGRLLVCGLDVSTSVTGVTLLEHDPSRPGPQLQLLTHVELAKLDGFWEKVDAFQEFFTALELQARAFGGITHVFVEESLQAFRPGLSSAATLMTLAKFNGVVCAMVRAATGCTPVPLSATTARKSCGIVIRRDVVDDAGKKVDAKHQTFQQLTASGGPLHGTQFPTKRGGKTVDWAYDEADSFVIARAGLLSLA